MVNEIREDKDSYFAHLKEDLDRRSREARQRKLGEERGIKLGEKRGIKLGEERVARNLKAEGFSNDFICEVTELDLNTVMAL